MTGLVKKEPALRVSGSPGLSTMPLRERILMTAARTSPAAACSPISTPSSAASSAYFTGADSDCRRSRNVTSRTTYLGWPAAGDRAPPGSEIRASGLPLLKRLVR